MLYYELISNIISIVSYFCICFSLIYLISKQKEINKLKIYLISLLFILFSVYSLKHVFYILNIWNDYLIFLIWIKILISLIALIFAISLYLNISPILKIGIINQLLKEYKLKRDIEKAIIKRIIHKLPSEEEQFQISELENEIKKLITKHNK